ncbi:MAG TPA: sigma-70 family RNA polymerase sigma factor [Ktedonobacteraceae bacterium]|jgi:RNA polymerase sigma factor (sigma-70 family)|nr:sigma-70 family RNA polymerase sigma factor [Ktedonobacteraceae bacterium]
MLTLTQERTSTTGIHYPAITDSNLVQQALAGDQKAFESLVHRYEAALFRLIYFYVHEYDEAHDILQQVWLQLYLSLSTLHTAGSLKPWLVKVARNRCIDVLRSKRLLYFSDLEVSDDEESGLLLAPLPATNLTLEEVAERHDMQRCIKRAIEMIPVQYRSVVWHYYLAEMTFPEIGQTLHMTESTAKTRFQRAKPFLRTALMTLLDIPAETVKTPANKPP